MGVSRIRRRPASVRLGWCFVLLAGASVLAAPPSFGQSRDAMNARMLDLARQMEALKPSLKSNPANAYTWSLLMEEYRRISEAMGGDDPARAGNGSQPAAASSPSGGGPTPPQGCGPISMSFSNTANVVIPTSGVVTSQINVANAGPYVWDLNVRTTIAHAFPTDLDITVMSPSGRVVTLTTDNGGSATNAFNGTVWTDDANPGGQVPYGSNPGNVTEHVYAANVLASPLVPEEALSAFRGEDPNGIWTLTISDDFAPDGGTLDEWTLFLAVFPSVPAEPVIIQTFQNTPLVIPTGPAVVTSMIDMTLPAQICGVNVTMDLEHTFPGDIDMTLMSPSGTIATLTTDNGGSAVDVFAGTNWVDTASFGGQVPYTTNPGVATEHPYMTGVVATSLVPEEAMGAFQGEQAFGIWTLTISDDAASDGGTLQSWRLQVRPCACLQGVGPRRADARASGGVSNVNGVVEPGERFVFEPRLLNTGPAFGENFEQINPPVLPRFWTTVLAAGLPSDLPWQTGSSPFMHSPPNAALATEPNHVTDKHLHTPSWGVNDANRILDFWHSFAMEDTFDGGVLEISIGGGAFQDILAAGGSFLVGGYTDTIAMGSSPIAGRQAWSGDSGGFVRTVCLLPGAASGQNVVFRFRMASDSSVAGSGWFVDTVALGGLVPGSATGNAFAFGGPGPGPYTADDATADYGTITPAASNNCFDATGNCYEFTIGNPGARPVLHWDASLLELLNTGTANFIDIHVGASFADVSTASGFYRFIETLLHFGITAGCGPTMYCPGNAVLREQMAVFLLVARFGAGYTPPACGAPIFADVPCASVYAPFINQLNVLGIAAGCGGGNFCPGNPVLREQMAVFLLVTYEGAGYVPPPCTTPVFGDVPCGNPYSAWINEINRRNIAGGCGGGNYCPSLAVTREQMAVFLTVTFALSLY